MNDMEDWAEECFEVSGDEAAEIVEFSDIFLDKEDLRVVLEDYFNIYNDFAKMESSEFNEKFDKYWDGIAK